MRAQGHPIAFARPTRARIIAVVAAGFFLGAWAWAAFQGTVPPNQQAGPPPAGVYIAAARWNPTQSASVLQKPCKPRGPHGAGLEGGSPQPRPYTGLQGNWTIADLFRSVSEMVEKARLPLTEVIERGMPDDEVAMRCEGTIGGWCEAFLRQTPIPAKAPPHGNRTCLNYCNGAGICNYDTGICDCIAGYSGDYCQYRQKRPCTNAWRRNGAEVQSSHKSTDPGWTASRCIGHCDEDIAACYCNGTYGRIPAPPDVLPLDAVPIQQGRPMTVHCIAKWDDNGERVVGGQVENKDLWNEKDGWCMAAKPRIRCPCIHDGWVGDVCDIRVEQFCLNQCSGHGECRDGWCNCHPGYYGHDCARRVQGSPEVPGLQESRPWLKEAMVPPPAAADPPLAEKRLRPLIYVYDLPADYNTRLLEYRNAATSCVWRRFTYDNITEFTKLAYSLDTLLHELLLQSPHRTLDPEEADFFYVPVYTACFAHPILGWADHPWYYGPSLMRTQHMAMMTLEAKRWVENHHPWWKRRGGADHIWLFTHDEAPCWVPEEIYNNSIILSHWGRKDEHPISNTAFDMDDYSIEVKTNWSRLGWTHVHNHHKCYEPQRKRDLLLPVLKTPTEVGRTPLYGAVPLERKTLLFFRGDFRDGVPPHDYKRYSRFIRQTLRNLTKEHGWHEKHNILIGGRDDISGDYARHLSSSIFCLVTPGDGYSPRAEDAVHHGCIPLIIMDDVDPILASVVDWASFSVRIAQADVEKVPEILKAIPEERICEMQANLGKVWHRFLWNRGPALTTALIGNVTRQRAEASYELGNTDEECEGLLPARYLGDYGDDAFTTLIAWLYKKVVDREARGESQQV